MKGSERFLFPGWSEASIPSLSGKTFIVTGANSGLGLETARYLVTAGARVVLACRSAEKAAVAEESIRRSTDNGSTRVELVDLADLDSIRRFAERITRSGERVDALLNNAGVFALDRARTADGFEMHFGVNHLGHFALTGLLLPSLLRVRGSRIVTVSSLGHRPARLDFDDPMFDRRRYSRWSAYCQSKLANLLFADELHRRLRRSSIATVSVAAHPGTARTEIGKLGTSPVNRVIRRFMPILVRDGVHGARAQVRAAVDEDVQGGEFFGPRFMFLGAPVLESPARRARNEADAALLWEMSEELTGVTFPV